MQTVESKFVSHRRGAVGYPSIRQQTLPINPPPPPPPPWLLSKGQPVLPCLDHLDRQAPNGERVVSRDARFKSPYRGPFAGRKPPLWLSPYLPRPQPCVQISSRQLAHPTHGTAAANVCRPPHPRPPLADSWTRTLWSCTTIWATGLQIGSLPGLCWSAQAPRSGPATTISQV